MTVRMIVATLQEVSFDDDVMKAFDVEGESLADVNACLCEHEEVTNAEDLEEALVVWVGNFFRLTGSPVEGEDGPYCVQQFKGGKMFLLRLPEWPEELDYPPFAGKLVGTTPQGKIYRVELPERPLRWHVENGSLLDVAESEYFHDLEAGDFLLGDEGKYLVIAYGPAPRRTVLKVEEFPEGFVMNE